MTTWLPIQCAVILCLFELNSCFLIATLVPHTLLTHTHTSHPHTSHRLCPRTGYYSNTFNQSQAWMDHHPTTLALLEDIYKTTGYNLTEDNLIHYTDCLRTHYCHKLELPHGMTMELYQRAWAEVSWQFYNLYQYPSVGENSRTGIGFLLKELGEVSLGETTCNGHWLSPSYTEYECYSEWEENAKVSALLRT